MAKFDSANQTHPCDAFGQKPIFAEQMNTAPFSPPISTTTFALKKTLDFYQDSLSANPECFEILCRLVDTTLVADHPLALDTVLNFVSNQTTLRHLISWKECTRGAQELCWLGSALIDLHPLYAPTSLSTSKPARAHFRGSLDKHHLLALLTEHHLGSEQDPFQWMHQLRSWLLVQAYTRNSRQIRLDENIRTVARSMLLGCDQDTQWLGLFFKLQHNRPPRSFSELNLRLAEKARSLLTSKNTLPKEKATLAAIIQISTGQDKEAKDAQLIPAPISVSKSAKGNIELSQSFVFDEETDADDIAYANPSLNLIVQETPENYSPAQRLLSTQTVLMANREQIQFLPWSWQRPNIFEIRRLDKWIATTLSTESVASPKAIATTIIWVARTLGRTPARTLGITIDNQPGDEWTLCRSTARFLRTPPMRKAGWRPDERSRQWVLPSASEITVTPPDQVRLVLMHALQNIPAAKTLRDIWPSQTTKAAELEARATLKEICPRLSGAELAEVLPQHVFEEHHDAVQARLLASHPQSALAGAHSYAQWSLETVTRLLSPNSPPNAKDTARIIGLGSRLAPLESELRQAIRTSSKYVMETRKRGDPIALHNAFTAYVAVALLAATGSRPIRSPFESIRYFDLNEEFVFIDDKQEQSLEQSGRIVPLPSGFATFLQKRYLPHLHGLAIHLREKAPALATELFLTAGQQPSGRMPFLVFINASNEWIEISPSALYRYADIDWPLPTNLFRHRFANQLRVFGVDAEVVEGLMGHAEWDNHTWSYTSIRSWADDVGHAQSAIDQAFRSLRFRPLRGLSPHGELSTQTTTEHLEELQFGAEARRRERMRRFRSTISEAKFTTQAFLSGRKLGDLTPAELDELADRLTQYENGLPIATAGIRLAYLLRQLHKLERNSGTRRRPSKERLIVVNTPSLFSDRTPNSIAKYSNLILALDSIEPTSLSAQRLIAVVEMCLRSRVSDLKVLFDVAANRNFRLITIGNRHYLESGTFDDENETCVRRHQITSRCAKLLSATAQLKPIIGTSKVPRELHLVSELLKTPTNTVIDFLGEIANIVEQANVLTLPGVVCGVLSGKTQTSPLGWRDTVRLSTGKHITIAEKTEEVVVCADETLRFRGTSTVAEPHESRDSKSKRFFGDLRATFATAKSHRPGKTNPRRTLIFDLERVLRKGIAQGVPASLLLLGQWITSLARPNKGKTLEITTLERYLTALSWRFEGELQEIDIQHADDEELTDAYTRVLVSGDKPAGEYEFICLRRFHSWLTRTFGTESPDWGELPVSNAKFGVSPGFITPQEYAKTLEYIENNSPQNADERLCGAMLLLLAYRFGLRKNEAFGLMRSEWLDDDERIVVIIQGNRWRKLKTHASRRQIPLVFELSEFEHSIISRTLTHYTAQHGDNTSERLIFCGDPQQLTGMVVDALRFVTRNPTLTLHHARHSSANLVALNAIGTYPGMWKSVAGGTDAGTCLLGRSTAPSRRHGWAIARFLGHASPTTTYRNYLHFVFDWADELIGINNNDQSSSIDDSITRIDLFPEVPETSAAKTETHFPKIGLHTILQAFRLHGRGIKMTVIAAALEVNETTVDTWVQLLESSGIRGSFSSIVEELSESAWDRLIEWTKGLPQLAFQNDMNISASSLREMVGITRQLLAWRHEHFALIRFALEYLSVNKDQYALYGSAQLHDGTKGLALAEQFELSNRPTTKTRAGSKRSSVLQIDCATTGPYREHVGSRIAFVFKENDHLPIRNRPQFILMIACVGLLLQRQRI